MDLRAYETVVILDPDLEEKKKDALLDRVRSMIQERGGEVEKVDRWGIRTLAYPIKKREKGDYYIIYYNASPGTVNDLEDHFRVSEGFLRFLSVLREEDKEERDE